MLAPLARFTGEGVFIFDAPSLSADGTKVAFTSNSDGLVPDDTNGQADLFVRDLTTGTTTRVYTAGTPSDNDASYSPSLSADGTKVAFETDNGNVVAGDTNGQLDVFVKDLTTGAITLVNTAADGTLGNFGSFDAALSADGTRVAFASSADNLVPGDTDGALDIFVKDLTTGAITRVDVAADGTQDNGAQVFRSSASSLSADGTKVAFGSNASNLVPGDTNGQDDVFVADVVPCYVTGTSILTERGALAVADLREGDRVVTASGEERPIRWIGHRRVDLARHPSPETVRPVRVLAGAFDGLPRRDLSVVDADGLVRSLPIDHPLLSDGCSFVQEHAGDRWRWTGGDAVVPAALWAGATGEVVLLVETAPERGTLRAWQAPDARGGVPASETEGSRRAA